MRATLFTTLLLVTTAAAAQTRASVRITGHTSKVASIRFHSATLFGEGVLGRNYGADGAVDYSLYVGDVTQVNGRDNSVRGAEVVLAVRANTQYVLSASASGTGFGTSNSSVQMSDIGFGIPAASVQPSGPLARKDAMLYPNARFNNDPAVAPLAANGEPVFQATLADLTTNTALLSGNTITVGGTPTSPLNALLVPTRYAVFPQGFKKNEEFEAVVTYTLATP